MTYITHTEDYKGYTINIQPEEGATPTHEFMDGIAPMMVYNDRDYTFYHCGCSKFFGDKPEAQSPSNILQAAYENFKGSKDKALAKSILKIVDDASIDYSEFEYYFESERNLYKSFSEYIDTYITSLLGNLDFDEGYYTSWHKVGEQMEACAAILNLLGIKTHYEISRGHSQGDAAHVLAIASPEYIEYFEANKEETALQYDVETWAAWAWGDVYRFEVPEINESCGMFYGDYDGEHGALQSARETIDAHEKHLAREVVEIFRNNPVHKVMTF